MNEKYKRDFIHAGKLANQVRSFGKSLIKIGASYNDVISKINQRIIELGGRAAFPPQIALNDVAAHYLPTPGEDIVFSNEVIKLDIGVCYNGAIGDCAVTIDLSGKNQRLIDSAEAALLQAEQSIKVGQPIGEIGRIIEETILSYGMVPVRNLSGHGLGYYKIHTPPSIPSYDDKSTRVIKPGMTFAIEPFATNGNGLVYESGRPMIYSFLGNAHRIDSDIARKLLVKIKTFDGLPFAVHDLISEELPFPQIEKTLAELLKLSVIAGYPPLVEKAHGLVAQAENSVLVDMKGNVFITTR
jgi:methionyl aminopeptidase